MHLSPPKFCTGAKNPNANHLCVVSEERQFRTDRESETERRTLLDLEPFFYSLRLTCHTCSRALPGPYLDCHKYMLHARPFMNQCGWREWRIRPTHGDQNRDRAGINLQRGDSFIEFDVVFDYFTYDFQHCSLFTKQFEGPVDEARRVTIGQANSLSTCFRNISIWA